MLFFKLFLLVLFSLILPSHVASYVYPMWGNSYDKQEKFGPADGDATVTEFIITTFLLPMRDSFCNVCANFLEVYECILANANYLGEQKSQQVPSILDQILEFIGHYKSQDYTVSSSCSYYSVLVVTISIMLFIGLIFITKKLVDYVKEEDRIFPDVLFDYQNKCQCHSEKE